MPSYDASMRNLARARARWRPPRLWRSSEESQMIRRFALQWFSCVDRNKPSGRAWARALGISHVWLLKLVRRFAADPGEARRLQCEGDPKFADLDHARSYTRELRRRGELRLFR